MNPVTGVVSFSARGVRGDIAAEAAQKASKWLASNQVDILLMDTNSTAVTVTEGGYTGMVVEHTITLVYIDWGSEPEAVEWTPGVACCCYEHMGDNPDCPTHGAHHAKAAPEAHALHDPTERMARTVERVEQHVNERGNLSLVKAGAS